MNRVAACAFVLICASPLACKSGGSPSPVTPLPAGCIQGAGGTHTLTVNDTATVSQECLGISKGKTKIVWQASANAKYLLVAFKDQNANNNQKTPPADPSCSGTTCELAKSKTQYTAEGEYLYSVVVILKSGQVASVDPRLIIQP